MKRAGSPESGRKKTVAKGPAKSPVKSKAARPAGKTVTAALKRVKHEATKSLNHAGKAAGGFAKKLADRVTSITKSTSKKSGKAAVKTAAKATPKTVAKTASKVPAKKTTAPAKTASKTSGKTVAKTKAPAKASAKASAKPNAKPNAKSTVKSTAKSTANAVVKTARKIAATVVRKAQSAVKRGHEAATRLNNDAVKTTTKAASKPTGTKKPAQTAPKTSKTKTPAAKTKIAAPLKTKVAPAKSPSRTLRPKGFAELETARGFGFPEETPELPEAYGEDRLVLMTKDPEYLFTYWEITPERRAQAERAKRDDVEYREALRLNWTSRDLLEDSFALLPVSLDAKRWYLRVPFSGLSYHVEIGWLSEQGHFISLLGSSNASDAPESWAKTRERLSAADAAVIEYSLRVAQPLGASESGRPVAIATKRPASVRDYAGPGAQSSSDAAVKIPAAVADAGKTRS